MSHTRAPEAISETMTELEDHETIASDKKRPDIHDHEHYLTVDDRQSSIRYSSTMRESRLYEHRSRAISNAYTSIHEGTGEGEEGGRGFHQGRQRTSSAYRASSCLKSLAVMSCHTFLDEEELELAHQTKSGMKEPFSTQLMMTFPPELCCATTADDDDEDDCGDSHYTKLYDDTDVDDDSNNTNNTSSCCSISLNARSFLVFVVSVALFVDYLLLTIIIPILHVVLGDLSSLYIGLLFATKPAMQIVFNFFVANFDPYSLMLYGAVVEAGTTLAFGFGTEYWHFALARGLQVYIGSMHELMDGWMLRSTASTRVRECMCV